MATVKGGSRVRSGYYWNPRHWTLIPVAHDGEILAGGPEEKFLRVPLPLALALVPLMGALFVFFLPALGFILLAQAMGLKLAGLFKRSAQELAATVTPGWQPGEAHLTGKRAEKQGAEKGGAERPPAGGEASSLEKLEREIEEKRGGEH